MTDAYRADLDTLTHECSHATVAVYLGRQLVRVIGHRHYARDDDEAGSVEYRADPDDPFGDAVIALAGRIGAEGIHLPEDTFDERQARRLCPDGIDRARAEALAILGRRDVRRAVTALAHALWDAPERTLSGPAAERIVCAALTG